MICSNLYEKPALDEGIDNITIVKGIDNNE